MRYFLYSLLGLFVALIVFIVVLVIKAIKFKPIKTEQKEIEPIDYDEKLVAEHLSKMIQCKTIANRDESLMDMKEYDKFVSLINELYPNAISKLTFERAGKTGLIYKWKGKSSEKPVVLMAHYDVVPANKEKWDFDPFSGDIVDGVVRGRGALDTKTTLCAIFEAVDKLCLEEKVPENDIYLCFSGTEEIAGEGAYAIVDKLKQDGIKPYITVDEGGAIIQGIFPGIKEPCAVVGVSEKGQMAIRLSVKSSAGHASSPPKNDAFSQLAEAISKLQKNQFKAHMTKATNEMFLTLGKYSTFLYRIIFGNINVFSPLLCGAARDFGNELNALLRTTYVFTMAGGSMASNVLPDEAWATCDVRILTGSSSEEVLEHFRKTINNDNIVIEPIFAVEPSPVSSTNCYQWTALSESIKETWPQALVSPYLMMARSDSSVYTSICDNVYRFSAMELSAEERAMIHGINEQIPAKKIVKAVEFYERLILKL